MGYIYLLEDAANGVIKIGQTGDLKERKSKYKTHHPFATWIIDYEVDNHLFVETQVLALVRQNWTQVPGTREWFHGTMTADELRDIIDRALAVSISQDSTLCDLQDDVISERVDNYFNKAGLPLCGILWAAHNDDGYEWASYVTLKFSLEPTAIALESVRVSVDGFTSALMLLLCAPDHMNLLQLVEAAPEGNLGPAWVILNSNKEFAEWFFEGLREIDVFTLLNQEVIITKPSE